MAAEQAPTTPEKITSPEAQELTPEQLEGDLRADAKIERAAEKPIENAEKAAEKAKIEALKEAVSVERGSAEKKSKEATSSPARRRHGVVNKKERDASYKQHMKHIQSELKPTARTFSKLIHNPVVEKTSEAIGGTVARPNAILSGAVVAFVLVLGVYLVAKFYGYPLSGFETIGAFIVGWVIGLLYDFFKAMITGKKV